MKKIETICQSKNCTAIQIGLLDDLMEHTLLHPKTARVIEGKVFLKEKTNATGTEISFKMLPPHTDLAYFHIHRKNEETYIFLRGFGDFQVDNDSFPVSEGTVVRVAPAGKRGLHNSSDEPMVYIVIQSKENSLEEYSTDDGERIEWEAHWDKS